MKSLLCFAVACLVAPAALAQELSFPELARRPDLWPAQCNLKQPIAFQGGVKIAPGPMKVLTVSASEIELTTPDGKTTFVAEPDETDVLAVARAAYAKLTPKQRALTYDSLVRQKELWPLKLTLSRSFTLADGKQVPAGEPVTLLDVQPGKLAVKIDRLGTNVQVAPPATDVITIARQLAENENAAPRFAAEQKAAQEKQQALGVVLSELDGKLVNSVTSKPQPLAADAPPKYFVFYRGSSTCPITRQLTPGLIKYYQGMKPAHPEVEFVWIMTESAGDTAKFARQLGFDWRAIGYESTGSMPKISQPITGLLPQLFVMDRNGRILANASQHAVPSAVRQLDTLLKTPSRQP